MKQIRIILILACALALAGLAAGQSVDAFFGFNALTAPRNAQFPYMGGGLYPQVGGDLMLFNSPFFGAWGIGAEVAWRGKVGSYVSPVENFAAPVRPILYDFNLVWEPISLPRITPFLEVGFGGESLRVYQPFYQCGTFTGCTDYSSSHHLLGHLGIGARLYLNDHIFIQPNANLYLIRHNVEYGVSSARIFGVAIGYTLRASPL